MNDGFGIKEYHYNFFFASSGDDDDDDVRYIELIMNVLVGVLNFKIFSLSFSSIIFSQLIILWTKLLRIITIVVE